MNPTLLTHTTHARAWLTPWIDWNPVHWMGEAVSSSAAQAAEAGAASFMTGLWSAAAWVLRFVFQLEDAFLTPDLSRDGPLRTILPVTVGLASILFTAIVFGQLILAAFRREFSAVGTVIAGSVQFALINAGGWAYMALLITGTSGLTHALLSTGLHIDTFSQWAGSQTFLRASADQTLAFVLGIIGLFLVWPAAIGHLIIMLARGVALFTIAATMPMSAAGLAGESTSRWFWLALRWFHAAAFVPPLSALVLVMGTQITNYATQGGGQGTTAAGGALIGALTIMIAAATPLALFRLLAFVDPGTTTGANFRAAVGSYGGISGLLSSRANGGGSSSNPATTPAGTGGPDTSGPGSSSPASPASVAESGASTASSARMSAAMENLNGLGAVAGFAGAAMAGVDTALTHGTDALNAGGVGHPQYYYGSQRPQRARSGGGQGPTTNGGTSDASNADLPSSPPPPPTSSTTPPVPTLPPPTPPTTASPQAAPPPPGGWNPSTSPAAGASTGVAAAEGGEAAAAAAAAVVL